MRILVSRSGAANRAFMAQELKEKFNHNETAYYIVPEQFTVQSDIQLMKSLGVKALFNIRVSSFTALSRDIREKLGNDGREPLLESGRLMLMRYLLVKNEDKLTLFKDGLAQSGTSAKLLDIFSQLRQSKISGEAFKKFLEGKDCGELLSLKIHEVAELLSDYEASIEGKFLDNEAQLMALAERVEECPWLREIPFYFDGYQGLNALEIGVIEALERLGVPLTFALILDPKILAHLELPEQACADAEVFNPSIKLLKQLQQVAQGPLEFIETDDFSEPPLLAEGVEQIFSYEPLEPLPYKQGVRFVQGVSTEDEVHAMARFIREKVFQDGAEKEAFRFRDFSIAVTDSSEYFPLVETIFPLYEIPVFIDQRKKLVQNPIAIYLINALKMATLDLPFTAVFAFLKSGFMDLTDAELREFENFARSHKLRGRQYFSEEVFTLDEGFYANKEKARALAEERMTLARAGMEKLRTRYFNFYESTRKKASVKDFATAVFHFLDQEDFQNVVSSWLEIKAAQAAEQQVEETLQVFKELKILLEQMVTSLGEMQVSFEIFVRIFIEGMESLTIGIIPPSQDQVVCGQLGRMRSGQLPFQMVLGLTDIYYPSSGDKGSVFLAKEQETLESWGLVLPSLERFIQEDDQLALYQTFTRPTNHLLVGYSLRNSRGETMHSAALVERMRKIWPQAPLESSLKMDETAFLFSPPKAMIYMMEQLRAYRHGELSAEEAALAYHLYLELQERDAEQFQFYASGLFYNAQRAKIDHQKTLEVYPKLGQKKKLSISEVECQKTCPFKHFIRYGIRPVEAEKFDLDKREIGNILHDSLKALSQTLREQPELLETLDEHRLAGMLETYLVSSAENTIEAERRKNARNYYFLKRTSKRMSKTAHFLLEQLRASALQPVGEEIFFGEGGRIPPLYLEIGEMKIALEGYIDRLDEASIEGKDVVRVLDYKTGNKEINVSKLLDGLDIQLLIYLSAAAMQGNKYTAGAFYIRLNDDLIDTEEDDREKVLEKIREKFLLDGIVVDNPVILQALDEHYDEKRPSVLRFHGRKTAVAEKDNVLSEEQMQNLITYIEEKTKETISAIFSGEITPQPYLLGKKEEGCQFCDYRAICRYEPKGLSSYRLIEEVNWKTLKEKMSGNAPEGGEA